MAYSVIKILAHFRKIAIREPCKILGLFDTIMGDRYKILKYLKPEMQIN